MRESMTLDERRRAVERATHLGVENFPSCDAFEIGCNCDLCREDQNENITHDWAEQQLIIERGW